MARPKGVSNRTTDRVIALLEAEGLELIREMAAMVKDPDTEPAIKAKLLSDLARFVYPQRKAQTASIEFEVGATHAETCQNVIVGIASGTIPPDVGSTVLSAIQVLLKAIEVDAVEARLAALEKVYAENDLPKA